MNDCGNKLQLKWNNQTDRAHTQKLKWTTELSPYFSLFLAIKLYSHSTSLCFIFLFSNSKSHARIRELKSQWKFHCGAKCCLSISFIRLCDRVQVLPQQFCRLFTWQMDIDWSTLFLLHLSIQQVHVSHCTALNLLWNCLAASVWMACGKRYQSIRTVVRIILFIIQFIYIK